MTPEDASKVLMVAAALDPRLRPPSEDDAVLRAAAWASVIDQWIDGEVGAWAVRQHYKASTDGVMPAHVNLICRKARADRMEAERSRRVLTISDGVPMPPEIKERMRSMWGMG